MLELSDNIAYIVELWEAWLVPPHGGSRLSRHETDPSLSHPRGLKRQVRDPPADSRADISGGAQDVKVTGHENSGRSEGREEEMPGVGGGRIRPSSWRGRPLGLCAGAERGAVAERCAPFGRRSAEGGFHGMSVGRIDPSLATLTSRPQTARERGS